MRGMNQDGLLGPNIEPHGLALSAGKCPGAHAAFVDHSELEVAIFGRDGYGEPLMKRRTGLGHADPYVKTAAGAC